MLTLLDELKTTLEADERLVIDGVLAKNKVIELALNIDPSLLSLLIKNKKLKKQFFQNVEEVLVFDKVAFQQFVSNKAFLPDSYTRFKNKIGLSSNDRYIIDSNDVTISWPYKDCVLEGGQTKEDQKRKEIFWNETLSPDHIDRMLSPKVLRNVKKHSNSGVTEVDKIQVTDNLIIKGNNLIALHSLRSKYANKVKLIYIDPPYNTGNDSFGYNDNFNHSTWLTFMRNRLEVAQELLKEDGSIFIQTDEKEISYLKVLCDEIFGRDNFISQITYERSSVAGLGQGGYFVNTGEYILAYSNGTQDFSPVNSYQPLELKTMKRYNKVLADTGEKTLIKEFISKSNKQPVKIYKHERYVIDSISMKKPKERFNEISVEFANNFEKIFRPFLIQKENEFQHEIISYMDKGLYSMEYIPSRGKNKGQNTTLYYSDKGLIAWLKDTAKKEGTEILKSTKLSNIWSHSEIPKADLHNEGGITFPRGKKPERLIERILLIGSKPNDIVMDFHLGSGTTCAVAHKMGRRYIGIEQLDYDENDSVIRLNNVIAGDQSGVSKDYNWTGGGSFVYCELASLASTLMNKIECSSTPNELINIWNELKNSNDLSYKINPQSIDNNIQEFSQLLLEQQKQFLIEVIDKNQLYVNYSDIDDENNDISELDKKLNKQFYGE